MPSRSGRNSTRRSAALVVWRVFDAGRVVAFPPGAGFGPEPGRNEVPGRAAAGRVRRVRVQEVRLQPGRPGRIQGAGFVDEDPGVGPGDRPGPQGGQGQRQRRGQGPGFGQQGPGGAFADGQGAGDLGDHGHRLRRAVVRGRGRCRQRRGGLHVLGGQGYFQRGGPGLQPGDLGQPVQGSIRPLPQRISIPQGIGASEAALDESASSAPGPVTAASAAMDAATASKAALLSAIHAALLFTLKAYVEAPTIMMDWDCPGSALGVTVPGRPRGGY